MKLGEAIVGKFIDAGVDTAFGVPGGGMSSDLLCNMDEKGMKFVLTQSETTAAIMAGVVGEITGMPGLCVTDLGPGALAMQTGLAYAMLDRAPLITLSDRYGHRVVDYALRQKISHIESFRSVTKSTGTLSEDNWNHLLNRGFKVATTPPYGPVHFDVPNDIIRKETDESPLLMKSSHYRITADEHQMKKAAKIIKQARFPVIIVGLGINAGSGEQYEALKMFATKYEMPVFKTAKAKGSFPDQHDLSIGVFMGGKLESNIMDRCDMIIAVGLDPVELLPKKWPYSQSLVAISEVPNNEEMYYADVEVVGDLSISLNLLGDFIADCNNQWKTSELSDYKKQVYSLLDVRVEGMTANEVVEVAQEVLPQDVIMTTDVGASKLIVSQLWQANFPRSFFISNGLATMGFALPAAMALQHVHPQKTIASLSGDGGFMARLADIATAVKNRWPVISIIFSDRRLSLMDVKQITKGYKKTAGTDFAAPDYVKFAESFGANGWSAETPDEFRQALKLALASNNQMPSIIEAKINPLAYYAQFNAIREL